MRSARVTLGFLLWSSAAAAQQYVISTFAGGGTPATPRVALDAAIGTPFGLATDAAGNIYFASPDLISTAVVSSVFKLSQNGVLTRVAGTSRPGYSGDGGPATSAQLNSPMAVVVDGAGNLFIADSGNHRVRKISSTGTITTIAGTGTQGFSGDGDPAISAQLNGPVGLALDGEGNLFIADRGNYRVRKVARSGVITTVAGNGTYYFSGDGGPAIDAALVAVAVAVDRAGNLFISDSIHVRKVSPDGIISTVAGGGTLAAAAAEGGPATSAQLNAYGIAVDGAGNLFIATLGSIRKVTTAGIITTVAGNYMFRGFSGDGGPATSAGLLNAFGVAVDGAGNLFIADSANYRIRQVSPSGIITTVAGNGVGSSSGATGDDGPATSVPLNFLDSVAADGGGNLFIADYRNNRVRKVSPSGIFTTVAGGGTLPGSDGDGGPATSARLSIPSGVAVDNAGNLFIADSGYHLIRKVSPSGIITTAAGGGTLTGPASDGGPATSAQLFRPDGLAVDSAGNLFIADSDDNRIRKVSASGIITTVAGGGTLLGRAADGGAARSAQLRPNGVAVDRAGNLFIVDGGAIRKVSTGGIISTVAGGGTLVGSSGDGGPATSVHLSWPAGVAVDSAGNLFIADPGANFTTLGEVPDDPADHRIRMVSPSGIINTVAGTGSAGYSGDGGPGATAALNGPARVAVDGSDNLYVADTGNQVVRILRPTNRSLLIGAVVDAASPRTGQISPGKIVVIYGASLGPVQLSENRASNGALGTELSGTTVSFNGIAAPILYTSATQVAAVVPYGITGTTAQVVVTYQGQESNEFTVKAAASAPSLFTANQEGWGQAAAINAADGSVNTAVNPVKIGGFISLFATGEGQTAPAGVDGRLGGATPARPVLPVSVTVGGIPATIQYAGSAPGQVAGLMQVNVQIPSGFPPGGYVPVILQVGDRSSGPAVWIAVSKN